MASEAEAKKLKRKRLTWNEASEAALLDLWPGRLEELRGQRKNGLVYSVMAEERAKLGFCYSPRDIEVKLQNFTQRHRKEKASIGVSGGSPSTWSQYGRVHQIIGGLKANLFTELTLESIDDSSVTSEPLSSPHTPLATLCSPLPPVSPLLDTGTSTSSESARKKRKLEYKTTAIEKFDDLAVSISAH